MLAYQRPIFVFRGEFPVKERLFLKLAPAYFTSTSPGLQATWPESLPPPCLHSQQASFCHFHWASLFSAGHCTSFFSNTCLGLGFEESLWMSSLSWISYKPYVETDSSALKKWPDQPWQNAESNSKPLKGKGTLGTSWELCEQWRKLLPTYLEKNTQKYDTIENIHETWSLLGHFKVEGIVILVL